MFRIFKLLKPKYKIYSVITVLFTIIQVVSFLIVPNIFGAISSLFAQSGATTIKINILGQYGFVVHSVNEAIKWIAIIFVITISVGAITALSASYLGNYVSTVGARDIRDILWNHIETLSQKDIESFTNAKIMTRFTVDISRIQNGLISTLRMLFIGPINLIVGLILSLVTNLKLSIVIGVLVPAIILSLAIMGLIVTKLFRKEQKALDEVNLQTQENILGAKVIKSYNLEESQNAKYQAANNLHAKISLKSWFGFSVIFNLIFFMANMGIIAVMVISGLTHKGTIGSAEEHGKFLQDITVFINYILIVMMGIIITSITLFNINRANISSKRVFEILDRKPSIPFIKSDKVVTNGKIMFDDVTFSYYETAEKNVIENVSFTLNAGETLGIIGPTGSGKSTIAKLISNTFKVEKGQIFIDDQNINEMDTNSLHNSISFVNQVPVILSGTIRSNLLFANANATEDDIINSTKAACAYEYINKFEAKFDHHVEKLGANLSGGQKQRLSIAQGLIRNPKILILDDSTSALDVKTEALVKQNIRHMFKDQKITTIIIAQKISSIIDADKIIVMHHGKLEDIGTHDELMKRNKLYQEIALMQMGGQNE